MGKAFVERRTFFGKLLQNEIYARIFANRWRCNIFHLLLRLFYVNKFEYKYRNSVIFILVLLAKLSKTMFDEDELKWWSERESEHYNFIERKRCLQIVTIKTRRKCSTLTQHQYLFTMWKMPQLNLIIKSRKLSIQYCELNGILLTENH